MKKESKLKAQSTNGQMFQRRLLLAFAVTVFAFTCLAFRIGWIQVVKTDIYAAKAEEMQMKPQVLKARRGNILDRNMNELVVNTGNYEVFMRLKPYENTKLSAEEEKKQRMMCIDVLSSTLGVDKKKLEERAKQNVVRIHIASNVDKNKIKVIEEKRDAYALRIEIEENPKREYPMGAFAAHVLGYIGKDGNGLAGIEKQYDDYLSGKSGRLVVKKDAWGRPLEQGENVVATNGSSLVLTLDETIQYYVENVIEKTYKDIKAEKMQALVMDPKTGDILAMANYPDFDPGDYGEPIDPGQLKEFKNSNAKKQSELVLKMQRNSLVSDLYEPGSVAKLLTASTGIETGAVTKDSTFVCNGVQNVSGSRIECWVYPGAHGTQTVQQAVGNSCNPAMVQIVQKIGIEKYYKQLELFGMRDLTGIDFPGEAAPKLHDKDAKDASPVDFATMSYGMGMSVTPIQMCAAVSAVVNGGNLMQPRLLKALADEEGNIIKEFSPKVTRKAISKQTSDEMRDIMEFTVEDAGAKVVQIPGYRIGAKTGTAQVLSEDTKKYLSSSIVGTMVAVAPMDDPQFVVMVIATKPKVGEHGSTTAGPAVKSILEEILRYKSIKPTESVKKGDN